MTIEDAIKHAEEVANNSCSDCSDEHRQLADWLRELVKLRKEKSEKKYEYKILYRFNGHLYDSVRHSQNIQSAQETLGVYSGYEDAHIVRRSVGEWEVME